MSVYIRVQYSLRLAREGVVLFLHCGNIQSFVLTGQVASSRQGGSSNGKMIIVIG